jgi:polyisoprenyl-teichoic acid--peptidoglycan teichoic acid transferase
VKQQARYTGADEVPYDREMIRSGGVSTSAHREKARRRPSRGQATPPRQRRRPERRRRRSLGTILRTLLVVTLTALVVVVVLGGLRAAAFNASVSSAGFPSTALLGPLNGSDRVNVLMVGYGGADHDGAYLADSIQVLSVDPTTDTTTTIPIPRDLWIEGVASFPRNAKVNEVFASGVVEDDVDEGGRRMAAVISEITGLRIEHWLAIDFDGFREMVDAVGGVTITNPTAFSYALSAPEHAAGNWNIGSFAAGEIHLDGDEALMYTRARYTSVVAESTDFARSVRQARVLGALRGELGEVGPGAIVPGLRLMDAMEGRVRTDLSAIDLFLLAPHFGGDRRVELTEGPVLTATTNTIGQYILIPADWTGPGAYGGMRAYLSTALAADAP